MGKKLSAKEIEKRLVKLRTYERLYPELKKKYEKLKREIQKRIKEQEAQIKDLTEKLETALLRTLLHV